VSHYKSTESLSQRTWRVHRPQALKGREDEASRILYIATIHDMASAFGLLDDKRYAHRTEKHLFMMEVIDSSPESRGFG
jgi:hypothetical protein